MMQVRFVRSVVTIFRNDGYTACVMQQGSKQVAARMKCGSGIEGQYEWCAGARTSSLFTSLPSEPTPSEP